MTKTNFGIGTIATLTWFNSIQNLFFVGQDLDGYCLKLTDDALSDSGNQIKASRVTGKILEMVPIKAFWQKMASNNIPRDRPADFDQKSAWEQILWIRTYGIPTAWKIIEKLEQNNANP